MADADIGAQETRARGMRAEKYLEESRYWFGLLRDSYKENIAQLFASQDDEAKRVIGAYGAKIAVLADIEQQLETLAAEGEIAAREGD